MMEAKLVVPGELVTEEHVRPGSHVFVENGKIYADALGLVKVGNGVARVVPLQGKYLPKLNDLVVGIVMVEEYSFYIIDINSFYHSFISKDDARLALRKGAIVSAKISRVNEINEVSLSNIRLLYGGEIIPIAPTKVPRVIGKNASMLKLLQHGTNCAIIVGMNGWVWAKGKAENIMLLKKALKKIERESHLSNLTLKIQKMLASKGAGEK